MKINDEILDSIVMQQFVDRVAIISGAGAGLGRMYAIELAKRGCKILLNDMNKTNLAATAAEIKAQGGIVAENSHNVLDGNLIYDDCIKYFGNVDILINNAGILRDKSFAKLEKNQWKDVIDVHLNGTFALTHSCFPRMVQNNYGRIINVSSGAGLYGNFGQANYSTAKMGIVGFTNTVSKEGDKYNVKCNAIAPIAATAMTATILPPAMMNSLDPKHVAPFVAYLASENCKVNGKIFELGANWYSCVRLQRSKGVHVGTDAQPATLEEISANIDSIIDFDEDATFPTAITDALKEIMAGPSSARPPRVKEPLPAAVAAAPLGPTPDGVTAHNISEILRHLSANAEASRTLCEVLDGVIQFDVQVAAGATVSYQLDFRKSASSVTVTKGAVAKPAVTLIMQENNFSKLLRGKLSTEFAYLSGALVVKGSMPKALKLKSIIDITKTLNIQ
jgi:NAD(P)-dependent dehydrogenase (short-subunit alcohol dehydrogenase family)